MQLQQGEGLVQTYHPNPPTATVIEAVGDILGSATERRRTDIDRHPQRQLRMFGTRVVEHRPGPK